MSLGMCLETRNSRKKISTHTSSYCEPAGTARARLMEVVAGCLGSCSVSRKAKTRKYLPAEANDFAACVKQTYGCTSKYVFALEGASRPVIWYIGCWCLSSVLCCQCWRIHGLVSTSFFFFKTDFFILLLSGSKDGWSNKKHQGPRTDLWRYVWGCDRLSSTCMSCLLFFFISS